MAPRKKRPAKKLEGESRPPPDMVPVVLDGEERELDVAEAVDDVDPGIAREVRALAAASPAVRYAKIEVREQLEQVEYLVTEQRPVDQIKRVLRAKWPRMTRERVLKLIERVRQKWDEETRARKPLEKEAAIRRVSDLMIQARGERDAAGNWVRQPNLKAALECERVMMDLQGTRASTVVDINVEHTQAMIAVIGGLQPDEGADLLAEAMEQAALAAEMRKLLPPGKS